MKTYINPERKKWRTLIERPYMEQKILAESVKTIIEDVERNGDTALLRYTQALDGCSLDNLEVTQEEISNVNVSPELAEAIDLAYENITKFHAAQLLDEPRIETSPGVLCWRKSIGIEKVGLYIPGGSAPLFSTILMLGIPAKIAGCKEVVLCTPPDTDGNINPAILYTANRVGITKIFKLGGAQAIAALAVGTKSVPRVSKIFGPGNQYVTKAKELIQDKGVAIDMPAGPSELLVIADDNGNPEFVAADLLSQAEHGADSQVVLATTSAELLSKALKEVELQLSQLSRKDLAAKALKNSIALKFESLDECLEFSNAYAPEHLIISTQNARELARNVINAGSVFIGNYSCESAGDYASGTNHTLPTNGYAQNYSGVSVDSFIRKITFQEISADGIQNLGPAIEVMAAAEQLVAHKNAVSVRLKSLRNE